MKINSRGIDLIKHFEGCQLRAYKCPAGVWTIGYGHTGSDVYEGQVISQEEAEELLKDDMVIFEVGVAKLLQVPVNENQFSALVSFAYNCGLGALKQSTLLRCLHKHNMPGAATEFLKWTKAAGRELPGLVKRRKAESDLFKLPV